MEVTSHMRSEKKVLIKFENLFMNKKIEIAGLLIFGVFLFVCSLEGVGYGFKLVFSEWANFFMSMTQSGVAPFTGLAIGVLCAALLESSSAVIAATMMSMAAMVGSGLPLPSAIRFGVPFVLGANLGTTVGNTIMLFAIRRSTTREEFNATIPAVIVDDMFKFINISLFFIIEVTSGFVGNLVTGLGFFLFETLRLEKVFALFEKNVIDILIMDPIVDPLGNVFNTFFGAKLSGILFFILWFVMILFSIEFLITKGLKKLIETDWAEKVSSAFKSPFKSWATGFSITWIVGSSSVGTSLMVPMVATKLANLEEIYPYVVGCALATTMDFSQIYGYFAGGVVGVVLGSAHVILNIFGTIIWLISPLRAIPLRMARGVGHFIGSSRNSPLLLIGYALLFVVVPLIILFVTQRI